MNRQSGYLLDPHIAVSVAVSRQYQRKKNHDYTRNSSSV